SMVGATGVDSLRQITESVSTWLGAECVMVGEIQPDRQTVSVVSMLLDGKNITDFSYTLKGTPCENVAGKGFCQYSDNVRQLFPDSSDLAELNIRGYIGTPLRNSGGLVIGILCALFRNPVKTTPSAQEILNIIAVKAAAEIERRRAEDVLQESEEHYRSLTEQVHDGIYIYQGNRFVFVNTLISRITGYSKDELLSMDFFSIVHPDDRAFVQENAEKRERGEHVPDVYEIRIIRKDRDVLYAELAVSIIRYKEGHAVLGTARDITEQKRAEQALKQANKKLNLLSSITRHDINNQLMSLNGFIGLLHENIPNSPYEKYFTRITEASSHITAMIRFTKEYEMIG
ncbi:MAG: hypothetical protein CVV34_07830, partial [Methanomicrobiales archaeon HGW-Methanomicrobiales-5]